MGSSNSSVFLGSCYKRGYEHAINEGIVGTDDSSLVEKNRL